MYILYIMTSITNETETGMCIPYITNLNLISEILMQNYLQNTEAILDDDESKFLDEMTNNLNIIFNNYNENENNETKIEFNADNFKSFIKKVYIKVEEEEIKEHERVEELKEEQTGGTRPLGFFRRRRDLDENHYQQDFYPNYPADPSDTNDWRTEYDTLPVLPITIFNAYPQRDRRKYDFIALVTFFVAIFMIYISYVKYNEISNKILSQNLTDVASNVSSTLYSQIERALSEINNLSSMELTFSQYVWKSIKTFSCSIINQQTTLITNIISDSVTKCITNFTIIATQQAQITCNPQTQIISQDYGVIADFVNTFVQYTSSAITIEETNMCIARQLGSEVSNYINNMNYARETLINEISVLSSQGTGFLMWGTRIGVPSTMYLTYRIYYLIQNNILLLRNRRGGTKYTKKQRKHKKSKKSNKSKKQKKHNKTKKYKKQRKQRKLIKSKKLFSKRK